MGRGYILIMAARSNAVGHVFANFLLVILSLFLTHIHTQIARQFLFEDGRALLTDNMNTALVAYLLYQRFEIDPTNIERAMSQITTVERNEALLSFLELKKDDPDCDIGVVLLECLRLAQPLLAESFIPVSHLIVWCLPSAEVAAVVINFLENSRSLKMTFGPVEQHRNFLFRQCCFKFVSTTLIVTFPERDGVEMFALGVVDACHKWKTIRLLVYSGDAIGIGVEIGSTVKMDPEHLENFPQPVTIPASCEVLQLPCLKNLDPPPGTTKYVCDPYSARMAVALSFHGPFTPCLLCSTVNRTSLERISFRARQEALETSAGVCLEGILASLANLKIK